jgi:hypothetical protein
MHAVRRPRHIGWPDQIAGDKGYSYETIRQFLAGCGIEAVIPIRYHFKCRHRLSNQMPPRPIYLIRSILFNLRPSLRLPGITFG